MNSSHNVNAGKACHDCRGLGIMRRIEQLLHYSLIETAKANGLEPYAYLTHVLKALPYADTVEQIEALLPWNLKK
jgi:hypothetical protein